MIYVTIVSYRVEPDLKARDSLCEDEVRYCSYRRQRVFKALQSLLGDKSPKDIKHVRCQYMI